MINIDFDKMVIESFDTVTFTDRTDGKILFLLDDITEGTIDNGQETVYSTGKNGVRVSSIDKNKNTKITLSNGFVIASAYAAQSGIAVEKADTTNKFIIPKLELVTVGSTNTITLEEIPVGTVGNEIPFIYKANSDRTQGDAYAIAAAASATEFSLSGDTITLPTGIFNEGDVVIIHYKRYAENAKKIVNYSDRFSKTGHAVFDLTCRYVCDNNSIYHLVIDMPNAKLDGNTSLSVGNEPAKHPFVFEVTNSYKYDLNISNLDYIY